jgi:hypothetical protein
MATIGELIGKQKVREIYEKFGWKPKKPQIQKLSKEEVIKLQEFRRRKKLLKKIYREFI